jgi:peptidoglycan/LPS O-acetylase OafA/YrhL
MNTTRVALLTVLIVINLAFVFAVTGVLSWLTYSYVEKPALRLKAKGRPAPEVRVPLAKAERLEDFVRGLAPLKSRPPKS